MTKQIEISFFNTINLKGQELKEAVENCNKQEERVLELFVWLKEMTPAECHKVYLENHGFVLLGSIRRSITVLTKRGKLEKLDEMKEGNYGKPNHKWRVK